MVKLYIGNLDRGVNEETLASVFQDRGLEIGDIQLHSKPRNCFAFVELADQTTADRAIDSLNGLQLLSTKMQVEPSVSKRRFSKQILLRNVLPHVNQQQIDELCSTFGSVQTSEKLHFGKEEVIVVTFGCTEEAQQAVSQLSDFELAGQCLKVSFFNPRRGPRNNSGMNNQRPPEFPLRILVPSDCVGAIIGKGGNTIKKITSDTRARVDVNRKENLPGTNEKAICIFGNPENCSKACQEIMKVVFEEAENKNKGEVPMKILSHNNLCGRLIGKGGANIKNIIQESGSEVRVSSVQELPYPNADRVITVSGDIDKMIEAEERISRNLRTSFENDMKSLNQQGLMMGGGMAPQSLAMMQGNYGVMQQMYDGPSGGYNHYNQQQPTTETCYLYVPALTVGAIIGKNGSHIKFVMSQSQAQIKVADKEEGEDEAENPERQIAVTAANRNAQYTAQFWLFNRVAEDARLRVEIMVPKNMVGRVIGKSGCNVREIQRLSTAIVKIPIDQNTQEEEVPVQIFGRFQPNFFAQTKIRQLVMGQFQPQGMDPRGRGAGRGRRPQENGNMA